MFMGSITSRSSQYTGGVSEILFMERDKRVHFMLVKYLEIIKWKTNIQMNATNWYCHFEKWKKV
jgi:hypothetical protein